MNIIVQKYGGTSVENLERIEKISDKIISQKKNDSDLVIVVSAQGKTTNNLIEKANEYSKFSEQISSKKDLDFLLATGEMQTAALLSLYLNSKGYKATCLMGFQAGILTNSNFSNAKILDIDNRNIIQLLNEDYIVIVTGFQGMDKFGNITTLGRGGSDLSAVAIASSLGAKKCEIYSDVDGIYTSDPRIVENAKLLNSISYDEMLEASSSGAKVLHNRSVNMAKEYNIPIISKSSFSNSLGSEVKNEIYENSTVHIITKKDNVTKICIVGSMMLSNIETISKIYSLANSHNIQIYMITFSELAINLIVDTNVAKEFMKILHEELIEKNTID